MSDYKREKVVRLKINECSLLKHFGVEDVFDIDCDERYSDFFGYGDTGKFQIASTETFFIDYVISSEYGSCCGEYGKTRHLYASELEKYKKIFSVIIPEDWITDDNIRVVEYCWYNGTDCASYFDEADDGFYDEI